MKKLLVGSIMLLMGLLLMTPVASAYPVSAGDYIKITDSIGGSNGFGGGAFNVSIDSELLFDTFCVERNENIALGASYYVGSITDGAIQGGISGGNPDWLSSEAAYLYSRWATGAIDHTDSNANALQLAIWKFEGEWEHAALTGDALDFYNEAFNNKNGSLYGVQVMNMYRTYDLRYSNDAAYRYYYGYQQDLLVYNGIPVPEPATLLLLGLGLLGVAGIRRFKK